MSFWAYMLHCRGGYLYVGHTDDIDRRIGEHKSGLIPGFSADHQPVELVWSDQFGNRDDAKAAERKLKGWSRAKKLALIRGDWDRISALAKKKDSASTSSAWTGKGGRDSSRPVRPELVEGSFFSLRPHADTPTLSVRSVEVEIARGEYNQLVAIFTAKHSPNAVKIPKPVRYALRLDGLWETTCFEAFVMRSSADGYLEFNFSPSTAWAGYDFATYRQKRGNIVIDPPHFDVDVGNDFLRVTVAVDTGAIEDLAPESPWQIGLSAVIEETDGTKSYWALAHPPGAPDFHHPSCFTATLPAPKDP